MADPFDLQRFEAAQRETYARALSEIRAGRKRSHWMWFVFPQIAGLGHSAMAQRYAIGSVEETRAYLAHPVLGARLTEIVTALQALPPATPEGVFGAIDAIKLHSSLTLTSHRAYKDAWSPQQALAAMLGWEGQFDPALLQAFMRSLGIYPVGTLVRLRDTSLCVVIADNAREPTLPLVRSFYSIPARSRVWCEDFQVASASALSLESPADWPFTDWPALQRQLLDGNEMAPPRAARIALA